MFQKKLGGQFKTLENPAPATFSQSDKIDESDQVSKMKGENKFLNERLMTLQK